MTTTGALSTADQDRDAWPDYGGGPDNSRFSTLKQIDEFNVGRLEVAWTYPYGETGFNPIVVRGVVYGRGRDSSLVAIDAGSGREIWIHQDLKGITARGVNYWESRDGKDRRLIFSVNDYLQELDAVTGKSILSFGVRGVVDLREGLGRDPATITRIQSNTPGKIFENLIILGSTTGEAYFSPPGDFRAYDVQTGKLVWTFHTVPRPGEVGYETWPKDAWKYVGGTNTWGEITIDADRGIAYFPTGSATFDFYGADRTGENLFANCLIALDARTGKRLWHFQTVHHDLWDYDNTSAPQLTTIKKDGRRVDVVAMAGKTGFLYVFNRVTGEPIWPIEERPVPTVTEVPGEKVWPTQPFPTAPPPFARQRFTADDINPYLLTANEREAFRRRVALARNEGLFTPIGFSEAIHMPGNNGGSNFGSTAANPDDGTVYVTSYDVPSIMRLLRPQEAAALQRAGRPVMDPTDAEGAVPDVAVDAAERTAAGTRVPAGSPGLFPPGPVVGSGPVATRDSALNTRLDGAPQSYPPGADVPAARYIMNGYGLFPTIVKPPYSAVTAYDLNSGTIKWQVPLGDDLRLAAQNIKGTGTAATMKFGIISTATGLLFATAGDRKVHAYDAETGRELWTGGFGAPTRGLPAMYEHEGRQYLLVTASSVGAMESSSLARIASPPELPKGYIAWALPRR